MLKEVSAQADAGGAERPRVYHHRLREALDLLADFFHAEGKGASLFFHSNFHLNLPNTTKQNILCVISFKIKPIKVSINNPVARIDETICVLITIT